MADKDILEEAREAFKRAEEAEKDNRDAALDDLRFARLGEQWPDEIVRQRRLEGRPCLTINRLPAFIRQVVNDARQNKPSVKVHPVDSAADPATAQIFSGLIRHIEYASNADVAYDTAIEAAVGAAFGYWRIGVDYAYDSPDLDIIIDRVADSFSVYGDPDSTAADSSDWNVAFVIERMRKAEFERAYPDAEKKDWRHDFRGIGSPWLDDDRVMVAEYWTREEIEKLIIVLSDGTAVDETRLADPAFLARLMASGVTVDVNTQPRKTKGYKVTQRILTGAEELEKRDWQGCYIPIVPVYGDEVNVEGKRHFRSLIRDAKDAQRMFNYWRTTSTELVALAPRVPFIGPKGSFTTDAEKWATINRESHAFVEYDDKGRPPERQPIGGGDAGALQQAMLASDDMKAIMGLHDASLGARSNETSGRAILARQREGDVSTFHFIDNLSRAIRHTGRILLDLIPYVYSEPRIVRIVGEDQQQQTVQINKPIPVIDPETNQPQLQLGPNGQPLLDIDGKPKPMTRIYDVGAGKYDITVTTGPSFTTRREEAAASMTELVRAFPAAAPVLGDLIARNSDWPQADEVAERLAALRPGGQGGIPPQLKQQIEQGQQIIAEGAKRIQQLETENAGMKADRQIEAEKLQLERQKLAVEASKAETARFEAETDRIKAQAEMARAMQPPAPVVRPNGSGQPYPA